MKVLVTGGAGFIGSNVVKLLKERGDAVFALDDFSHASSDNLKGIDCEVISADIIDDRIYKKLPSVDKDGNFDEGVFRNGESFIFSRNWCGSEETGYRKTIEYSGFAFLIMMTFLVL